MSKDEAHLWVIGLQIVVPSSNVPGLEFVRATNPLPGNLDGAFKRGETRAIPSGIGRLSYDVTYPGLIRAAVRETVRKVLVGSIGVAPWTLNFDDFVGGERIVERVTGQAVFHKPFTLDLRKHENIGAHYRVTGALRFEP